MRAPSFRDHSRRVVVGSVYDDDFNEIVEQISAGTRLQERFYRAGIDDDHDALLEQEGVIHLHLGGKNSDVLLFLVQYPDRVVLLEINTHKHFKTDPVGSILRSLHEQYLVRTAHEALAEAGKAVEQAAKANADKLAAAKEKLKVQALSRRRRADEG